MNWYTFLTALTLTGGMVTLLGSGVWLIDCASFKKSIWRAFVALGAGIVLVSLGIGMV